MSDKPRCVPERSLLSPDVPPLFDVEARGEVEAVLVGEGFEPGFLGSVRGLVGGLRHEPDLIGAGFGEGLQIGKDFGDVIGGIDDEFELNVGGGEHAADGVEVRAPALVEFSPFWGTLGGGSRVGEFGAD